MAPIGTLWARLLCVFDLLTGSPEPLNVPQSVLELQIPESAVQPVQPQATKYPIFNPPDDLEPTPFRCEYPDYPEKDGWEMCNTNTDRQCWLRNKNTGQRFDIDTDYENNGPKGVVRHYYLELANFTRDPDGNGSMPVQLFNNSFPGPRLQACWGDQLSITIKNLLLGSGRGNTTDPGNGTAIHWHGFRQLNSSQMDGVNAVTQCPLAPGEQFTYVFNATQYGTSWYHSHYSLQYAAGALGPMTVYGPMSKNFDHQIQPIIMSDWLHKQTAYQKWDWTTFHPGRIWIDNILQNGIGHWPPFEANPKQEAQVTAKPRFNEVFFQKGVKYLLRLINGAADTTFVFSIDNHRFWVISTDFVAIEPYYTDHVVVGIGQRYNIIVEAIPDRFTTDQNYWIRTTPAPNCTAFQPSERTPDDHTGIVRYTLNDNMPTTLRQPFEPTCADETYFQTLKPIVRWRVSPLRHHLERFYLNINFKTRQYPYWPCNRPDLSSTRFELVPDNPMWLNFSAPTLLNLDEDFRKKPWLTEVTTPDLNKEEWIQITIISGAKSEKKPLKPHPLPKVPGVFVPGQHPIHLHGHDFAVLDQCVPDGKTECDVAKATLNLDNPPRRDVAFLADKGYLIIAFKADNPGVWIMHCHIAFHASMGLATQIIENKNKIPGTFGFGWDEPFMDMCRKWDKWQPDDPSDPCMYLKNGSEPLQTDSGI